MDIAPEAARVLAFDSIDSTNAEARRLAAAGERGPVWIRAARQTAGKGRQGRTWVSEPGNLYATLLATVRAPARVAAEVGFVASLSVADAVADLLGDASHLSLKWPNDVLLAEAKVAGILAETAASSDGEQTTIAIGCGVNIAHAPVETRFPATSLAAAGVRADPDAAFAALGRAMAAWFGRWDEGRGFAGVRQAWLLRAYRLGQEVTLLGGEAPVSGIFRGLAQDGAILLAGPSSGVRAFHAGEVSLAAPFAGAAR